MAIEIPSVNDRLSDEPVEKTKANGDRHPEQAELTVEQARAVLIDKDPEIKIESWSLPSRVLDAIWNGVYNRIVALAWQSKKYKTLFELSTSFRRGEFNRILGILYLDDKEFRLPENMEVCVRDAQRRTDLLITPEGLVFPWPEMIDFRPNREKLHEAYHLSGGLLPGFNGGWKNLDDEKLDQFIEIQKWYVPLLKEDPLSDLGLDKEEEIELVGDVFFQDNLAGKFEGRDMKAVKNAFTDLFEKISNYHCEDASTPEEQKKHCEDLINRALTNDAFIIGEQFRSLAAQVPKIIARAWDDPDYQMEYIGRDKDLELVDNDIMDEAEKKKKEKRKMKLIDIDLPGNIGFHVDETISDITIKVEASKIFQYNRNASDINWELCLPYIPIPGHTDVENIAFREMIAGCASNPLYTNTY